MPGRRDRALDDPETLLQRGVLLLQGIEPLRGPLLERGRNRQARDRRSAQHETQEERRLGYSVHCLPHCLPHFTLAGPRIVRRLGLRSSVVAPAAWSE